jgi:hypothetical protein
MALAKSISKKNSIDSHILLGDIFDSYSINKLVGIFNNGTIAKYVQRE